MKSSFTILVWLVASISNVAALPEPLFEAAIKAIGSAELDARTSSKKPTFNATDQYVSTSGDHRWIAPTTSDARGPCPGLNVMANHGYLPRNGYATIPQFISACKTVFRMSEDLATVLAVFGATMDGNGVAWSIGGYVRHGISGSHNNYETDSSPLRGDLNQYGYNSKLVMEQFYELYKLQPRASTANYNLNVLKTFRGTRFNESVANNPWFFYGPFNGVIVSQAAFIFTYRFMANKSAEYPEGRLDKDTLKSFQSIYGPENDLKWKPGHERIPSDWFTRPTSDQYDVVDLNNDINEIALGQEYTANPGCNRGNVNDYIEIPVFGSTAGVGPDKDTLCYGLAYALDASAVDGVVSPILQKAILPAQKKLKCPTIPPANLTALKGCPGFSEYGGPRGKVAPGAIQG